MYIKNRKTKNSTAIQKYIQGKTNIVKLHYRLSNRCHKFDTVPKFIIHFFVGFGNFIFLFKLTTAAQVKMMKSKTTRRATSVYAMLSFIRVTWSSAAMTFGGWDTMLKCNNLTIQFVDKYKDNCNDDILCVKC